MMHRDLPVRGEQSTKLGSVLRMQLASCQAVVLAQQRADQDRRTRIKP
jgi:hypothetical protein